MKVLGLRAVSNSREAKNCSQEVPRPQADPPSAGSPKKNASSNEQSRDLVVPIQGV